MLTGATRVGLTADVGAPVSGVDLVVTVGRTPRRRAPRRRRRRARHPRPDAGLRHGAGQPRRRTARAVGGRLRGLPRPAPAVAGPRGRPLPDRGGRGRGRRQPREEQRRRHRRRRPHRQRAGGHRRRGGRARRQPGRHGRRALRAVGGPAALRGHPLGRRRGVGRHRGAGHPGRPERDRSSRPTTGWRRARRRSPAAWTSSRSWRCSSSSSPSSWACWSSPTPSRSSSPSGCATSRCCAASASPAASCVARSASRPSRSGWRPPPSASPSGALRRGRARRARPPLVHRHGPAALDPVWTGAAFAVGTLVTLAAAWLPTRSATKVAPLAALRPDTGVDVRSAAGRWRLALAALGVSAGAALLVLAVAASSVPAMLAGGIASFVGVLLLGPVLVPRLIRLVGGLPGAGPVRRLATGNAVRNPRRTATTAASLLVGVTLTTAILTGLASSRTAIDKDMDRSYPLDATITAVEAPLDAALVDRVADTPGVAEAVGLDGTTATIGRVEVALLGAGRAPDVVRGGADLAPEDGVLLLPYEVVEDLPAQTAERVWEDGEVTVTVGGREHTLDVETGSGWGRSGLVSAATLASLDPDPQPMAVWARASDGADAEDLSRRPRGTGRGRRRRPRRRPRQPELGLPPGRHPDRVGRRPARRRHRDRARRHRQHPRALRARARPGERPAPRDGAHPPPARAGDGGGGPAAVVGRDGAGHRHRAGLRLGRGAGDGRPPSSTTPRSPSRCGRSGPSPRSPPSPAWPRASYRPVVPPGSPPRPGWRSTERPSPDPDVVRTRTHGCGFVRRSRPGTTDGAVSRACG